MHYSLRAGYWSSLLGACLTLTSSLALSQSDSATTDLLRPDQPRPTPVTRPEMKKMLEDMKGRKERFPLPPLTEEETKNPDPRTQSYEGRLTRAYLGDTPGARGYLNFSGSARRTTTTPNDRPPQEEDPKVTLDYGFKTKLFWIASRANNCQYCLGHQESKLLAVGMQEDQLAALDADWSQFSDAEQAAFAFARRLTLEPHRLSDEDIQRCRKYYTDLQILEMALSVGGNNAINRWKEGSGVPQSSTGGNFGGASGGNSHSYLTETNPVWATKASKVIRQGAVKKGESMVPTLADPRDAMSVRDGLSACKVRTARLPVPSQEDAKAVFGDQVSSSDAIPGWIRLLANFPVAGKRQLTAFQSADKLPLSDTLKGQVAWVIARQNGAWYSLSESQSRLKKAGMKDDQIGKLDTLQPMDFDPATYSLLVVAKNLAASPVTLTDQQVEEALRQTNPATVIQVVHYTAMRSLFDRYTEAAGLPSD
ncbi:MAG: hypothetical protein U0905_12995 [Pirellulales bacterium]